MHLDLAVAGLVVGLLVGFIGMGGGALLTPLLVLFFQIAPLAAISSDLLTSLVMMPVGAAVHLRCRTVNWRLVRWLTMGSVPDAFAGAVIIGSLGHAPGVQADLKLVIGIALCASVGMTLLRQVLDRRASRRGDHDDRPLVVYPLRTVAIGVIGGFAVGMTSVGGGSLVIALLLIAYPQQLRPAQLAGTGRRHLATARRAARCLRRRPTVHSGPRGRHPAGDRRGPARLGAGAAEGAHPAADLRSTRRTSHNGPPARAAAGAGAPATRPSGCRIVRV
jgi:uncharacterized membrane protein YfcA